MDITTIHVMRHGEVDNPRGLLYGRLPGFGLTPLGHDMARTVAEHLLAEGRDITTVIAPDADVRVLLIADPEARVARRAAEVEGKATAEEVTDQVLRRDRDDSTVSNFTDAAEGVVVIDSTFPSPDQVVDRIVELAR